MTDKKDQFDDLDRALREAIESDPLFLAVKMREDMSRTMALVERDRARRQRRFEAACAAMTGLIAAKAAGDDEILHGAKEGQTVGQWVAEEAVGYADALLAELDKKPEVEP